MRLVKSLKCKKEETITQTDLKETSKHTKFHVVIKITILHNFL